MKKHPGKHPSGHTRTATSGSHAHHGEYSGPGPEPGAGELAMGSPGPAAMKVTPHPTGVPQPAAKTSVPKGMDIYKAGS